MVGRCESARAMVSRCCCPPESFVPRLSSRSLTSSHSAACVRQRSHEVVERRPCGQPGGTRGEGDVVVDRERQSDRQRRHHADLAAQRVDVARPLHVLAVDFDDARPSAASGVNSSVRFRHRSSDVLPDCAGPMTPRISPRRTSKEMPWITSVAP